MWEKKLLNVKTAFVETCVHVEKKKKYRKADDEIKMPNKNILINRQVWHIIKCN